MSIVRSSDFKLKFLTRHLLNICDRLKALLMTLSVLTLVGSGCGSVGRAVISDTRGLQFESSHRQNPINLFTTNCIEKTKINKKRPGMVHF